MHEETARTAIIDKSVAVLPFVAMSDGPDDEYFADGLTEEILNSLAQLPELLVSARTSAFYFKGQVVPIDEITAKLGVAHIVEGSVRRDGEQLRITAQLIRASDGFHLWSDTYDRLASRSFAVQSEIAEKVASSLDVVLDDEKRASMRVIGLRNPEAFVAYQKGVELFDLAHGDAEVLAILERANTYFERTIELAPTLSAAYERHADYFSHVLIESGQGVDTPMTVLEATERLRQDLQNAIRHAPSKARGLSVAFDLAFLMGEWSRLPSLLDELALHASCESPTWTDLFAIPFQLNDESRALFQRALECDPMSFSNWTAIIRAAIWSGDAVTAVETARNGLNAVPHVRIRGALETALIAAGEFDQARRLVDTNIRDDRRAHQLRLMLASARGDSPVPRLTAIPKRAATIMAMAVKRLVDVITDGLRELSL